jgi:NADH-quinone oxidoreductase subunit N
MLFLVLVTALWMLGSAEREKDAPEFFVLLLSSALGMVLMVSTLNLLMIVIAIELASLPSYAIAGFDKRSRVGAEASLKYVIFGAVTAAIMVYGVSLLYGFYGTMNVTEIATGMFSSEVGTGLVPAVGLLAFFVGVAFKISAVPFHFWCPDVFEGAKIEVTTWLSVSSKAAGLCLLLRVVFTLANTAGVDQMTVEQTLGWLAWGIGIVAALTCTYANLVAYQQNNVKRLLAYSSIAHAGYMLMAGAVLMVLKPDPLDPTRPSAHAAISAVVAYALVYLFMNIGAFGTVAMVYQATGKETLDAYRGLWRRAPWLAVPMAICLFSLVGMPPLGGFMVKFWLLGALFEAGSNLVSTKPLLYSLVIVAVLNTLLSLFYYLRIVREMFLNDDDQPAMSVPVGGLAIVNVCAAVLVVTGTFGAPLLQRRSNNYATDLFLESTDAVSAEIELDTAPPEPTVPVAAVSAADPTE